MQYRIRSWAQVIPVLSQTMLLAAAAFVVGDFATAADAPQTATPQTLTKAWKVPRTAGGHPDFQGVWTSATLTSLERRSEFGDRRVLTDAEVRKIEGTEAAFVQGAAKPTDLADAKKANPDCTAFQFGCGYNNFWIDRGSKVATINGEKRSSLIIDPPNGKIPPLTAQRQKELVEQRRGRGRFDGPETLTLAERCLLSFGSSSGPPMLPVLYNNHYQFVQSKDTVMIQVEMVHDARMIRIDGKHVPNNVPKWMGDSIGHWEGDTLVVETTNFNAQQNFRGSTPRMKVTERFTRVAPDTINYQFTVDDPAAFSRPFSGEMPFYLTNENIFEYGCHEGNYALPGILNGGREDEKQGRPSVVPDRRAAESE